MKKIFKPASLLFNLLSLLVFLIVGMFFAGWIEGGKEQGLAGGAIVLGWGFSFAVIAFIVSLFLTNVLSHAKVVTANWLMLLVLLLACGIAWNRMVQRNKLRENRTSQNVTKFPTTKNLEGTAMWVSEKSLPENVFEEYSPDQEIQSMGFFMPNFYEHTVLYFYPYPNFEKALPEYSPFDSITFKRNQYNQFEIATAPPWLVPEILKLDYDMLYFKIVSVSSEFVEIVVSTKNNQTSYVSRSVGKILYWPDFLLLVHSVEFISGSNEQVRVHPIQESGIIKTAYQYMRPVKIKGDWAEVFLLNEAFQKVGEGWIQWKVNNRLLIKYNLLS